MYNVEKIRLNRDAGHFVQCLLWVVDLIPAPEAFDTTNPPEN